MPYEHQYTDDFKAPTLEEMTTTAIKYLENKSDENGFFLMVEGGLIDHAHHGSEVLYNLNACSSNLSFYQSYNFENLFTRPSGL